MSTPSDPHEMVPPYTGDGYDHNLIVFKALWPMVNSVWGGDWLENSKPNQQLQFPKVGKIDGRALGVILIASCDVESVRDPDTDELITEDLDRTVVLSIEQRAPDVVRSLADLALEQGSEPVEQMRGEDGELQYEKIVAHFNTQITGFDDGSCEIMRNYSLDDMQGRPLWLPPSTGLEIVVNDDGDFVGSSTEDPAEPDEEFNAADISNIADAAEILGAHKVKKFLRRYIGLHTGTAPHGPEAIIE